jgi:hypothetical protein
MDSKKAVGPDGLLVRFLQLIVNQISPVLCHLIKKSFSIGKVLNIWKLANVTPLHKSGNLNDINNYRSISVLLSVSKTIEKIVCKHLLKYLTANKLISDKQFGFGSRHSRVYALLSIQKIVLESVNARKKYSVVSLDLCKAYDSVDHKLNIKISDEWFG